MERLLRGRDRVACLIWWKDPCVTDKRRRVFYCEARAPDTLAGWERECVYIGIAHSIVDAVAACKLAEMRMAMPDWTAWTRE